MFKIKNLKGNYACDICLKESKKKFLQHTKWGEICGGCEENKRDYLTLKQYYQKVKAVKGNAPERIKEFRINQIKKLKIKLGEDKWKQMIN